MEEKFIAVPRIPVSTYRLQFNHTFRFSDAKKIIPYLYELGITDIYASPYFKARKGSLHGYDIFDNQALNPEVGSSEDYNEMTGQLKKHGMGQILDIVPNHMCISSNENRWWMDILENGPSSHYSSSFDINWNPVKRELKDRVLLPILGDQYGKVLEKQELKLVFEEGVFLIIYFEQVLPVNPQTYSRILQHDIEKLKQLLGEQDIHFVEILSIITAISNLPPYTVLDPEKIEERYREKEIIKKRLRELYNQSREVKEFIDGNIVIINGTKGEAASFDLLDSLLGEQVYRLSFWRVATDEINYRRFFDINELAAIRMEDPTVFEESHKLVFRLIEEEKVTGLRVDHPDGLYDPPEYFRTLQKKCYLHMKMRMGEKGDEASILKEYEWLLSSDPQMKPFYIIGEKILTRGEKMPEDWPIFNTIGYLFLNSLNGIFVDAEKAETMDAIYVRFTGFKADFQEIVYEKKRLVMEVSMSSEVNNLAYVLNTMSEKNRYTRDFTLNSLKAAIEEVVAFFPIYRTYVNPSGVDERDRKYIEIAISKGKRKNPAISESVFDFLRDVLLLNYPVQLEEPERKEWLDFAMRFQQMTGPVMAKGLEDTAFYAYNRLVSLNEVGGSPDRFGMTIEAFHGQNIERSKAWPQSLITTNTHDTKRSEDVRARINVLSEIPDEWRGKIFGWARMNKKKKISVDNQLAPDRNEEYLFYQTLIGAWPDGETDGAGYEKFRERIKEYMLKAVREAKVNSSWINPNTDYENAVISFIESVMDRENLFIRVFDEFRRKVSWFGKLNSLSQTLLKITSPGVPDFYQGTEIWDYSLVDPDNRRPVDYDKRMRMLSEIKALEAETGPARLSRELAENPDDGKVKLYLTFKALNFRRDCRDIFEKGEYLPLEAVGDRAGNVCAFARREGNKTVVVIVPRFFTGLVNQPGSLPLGKEVWGDSFVKMPFEGDVGNYRNIFTGETVRPVRHEEGIIINLSEIFSNFTVALLEGLR